MIEIYDTKKLKTKLKKAEAGILFCFGTSLISRIIQIKTQHEYVELVPSHVAMFINGFIYESTIEQVRVNNKVVHGGVRRWKIEDFIKFESKKDTKYVFFEYPLSKFDLKQVEDNVHRPYGRDTILEYVLKDEAQGSSKGLICSQYVNLCTHIIDKPCVTPADLYRKLLHTRKGYNYDDLG